MTPAVCFSRNEQQTASKSRQTADSYAKPNHNQPEPDYDDIYLHRRSDKSQTLDIDEEYLDPRESAYVTPAK